MTSISQLSKTAWIGFCLFGLSYAANWLLPLSNNIRDENFPLASILLALFTIGTIVGIFLTALSATKDSGKIAELECRLEKLEKIQGIDTKKKNNTN